jgi:hypothetical protein
MKRRSNLEFLIENRLKAHGFTYVKEYKFHPTRRWRFDFLIPALNLAIECEGGIWIGGRHSRGGISFIKDMEKYNEATLMEFRILRYTTSTIDRIIPDLERLMNVRFSTQRQPIS